VFQPWRDFCHRTTETLELFLARTT
jgi:hypothetical protein